jgi:hypothetical protein
MEKSSPTERATIQCRPVEKTIAGLHQRSLRVGTVLNKVFHYLHLRARGRDQGGAANQAQMLAAMNTAVVIKRRGPWSRFIVTS